MSTNTYDEKMRAPPERRTLNVQHRTSKGRRETGAPRALHSVGRWVFAAAAILLAETAGAGSRVGGSSDFESDSLNSGGISYATNANVKLGGSFGQFGLMRLATNSVPQQAQNGFWKAETPCAFYAPYVMGVANGTSRVAITFNVLWSNSYLVTYVTEEEGGIDAGTHAFTNPVPPIFSGQGGIGSTTTIWDNVASATNKARYYLIQCQ